MAFTEELLLPSRGIIYRIQNFNGVVNVKPFTTKLYKDLLASNASNVGLQQFIEGCLVDCPVKAKDMNQEDLLAILIKTRIMTLGNNLKMQNTCPHCGSSSEAEFDLDHVEINYLHADNYPVQLTLPSGQEIRIRIRTGADSRKAEQAAERRAKIFNTSADLYMPIYNTVALLDVDGKDIVEKAEWYENLNPIDSTYIDAAISEINDAFGVKMSCSVDCEKCDKEYFTYINIGNDFFRPHRNIVGSVTGKTGYLSGADKKSDTTKQES